MKGGVGGKKTVNVLSSRSSYADYLSFEPEDPDPLEDLGDELEEFKEELMEFTEQMETFTEKMDPDCKLTFEQMISLETFYNYSNKCAGSNI